MRVLNRTLTLLLGFFVLHPSLNAAAEDVYLDISISLFTTDIRLASASANTEADTELKPDALQAIHSAETRYMPVMLALRMIEADAWGAVRVTTQPDPTAELGITATILHSDHESLQLHVKAIDSSGRIWTDREYSSRGVRGTSLYQNELLQDPFQSLYNEIQRELGLVLATLGTQERKTIKQLSLLRYGGSLSPETFSAFISETDDRFSIERLPAEDDPMMRRITDIRDREYLFIDVVNEQFQQFFTDIKPLYDLWRSTQVEQQARTSDYEEDRNNRSSDFSRGSYYALREQYERFRSARIEDQYSDELITGFTNEAAPTEMALEETLVSLTGTLDEQYVQWRNLLKELFLLETGASNQPQ